MTRIRTRNKWIQPGTVVGTRVWTPYPVLHLGIATDRTNARGDQLIISNSKRVGRVAYETVADFGEIVHVDYPSREHPSDVLHRAEQELGRRWRLFDSNCEHFVRRAHRLEVASPQVQGAMLLTLLFGMAYAGSRA